MARFKDKTEEIAARILRKVGVPEQQLPARMKSVGSYMILVSITAVVPLVFLDNVPLALTIILQLLYAALMCVGLTLAVKEKK